MQLPKSFDSLYEGAVENSSRATGVLECLALPTSNYICLYVCFRVGRRPVFFVTLFMLAVGRCLIVFTASIYPLFLTATVLGSVSQSAAFQSPLVLGMNTKCQKIRRLGYIQLWGLRATDLKVNYHFYSGGTLSCRKISGFLSNLAEKQFQVSIIKLVKCHWARVSQTFEGYVLSKRREPLTKRYSDTCQIIWISGKDLSNPLSKLYLCICHLIVKRAMLSESITAA